MEIEKYTNQQKQIIKDTHMKHRCWIIFTMFSLSLYNWVNYSMFETPIINNISKPYYWNCLLFLIYLLWDTYKMTLSKHKTILYRTDLLLHHIYSFIMFSSLINWVSLNGSYKLIMECISLLNYVWKEPKYFYWLNYYRLVCIFLIRIPVFFTLSFYILPYYTFPYYKSVSYFDYLYIYYLYYGFYFFIIYDLYLIKQITSILFTNKIQIPKNIE
jgi:hypothetical protein